MGGSFITELSGASSNYPYDSYIFGVNVTLNYPIKTIYNYTITLNPSNRIANAIQDSWIISTVRQHYSFHGNQTILTYEFQLSRSGQPVSLPTIAYAAVVLLAAALLFEPEHVDKRLTVFLGAIVLSLSVLISQNLNPFGYGNTIFETFFSYLMSQTQSWFWRPYLCGGSKATEWCRASWMSLPWWVWISPTIVPISGLSASFSRHGSKDGGKEEWGDRDGK